MALSVTSRLNKISSLRGEADMRLLAGSTVFRVGRANVVFPRLAHEHDTEYLRVFVSQLRRKLGDDPPSPQFILNEPWVGYWMLEPDI
jgi:hypothetical protein